MEGITSEDKSFQHYGKKCPSDLSDPSVIVYKQFSLQNSGSEHCLIQLAENSGKHQGELCLLHKARA